MDTLAILPIMETIPSSLKTNQRSGSVYLDLNNSLFNRIHKLSLDLSMCSILIKPLGNTLNEFELEGLLKSLRPLSCVLWYIRETEFTFKSQKMNNSKHLLEDYPFLRRAIYRSGDFTLYEDNFSYVLCNLSQTEILDSTRFFCKNRFGKDSGLLFLQNHDELNQLIFDDLIYIRKYDLEYVKYSSQSEKSWDIMFQNKQDSLLRYINKIIQKKGIPVQVLKDCDIKYYFLITGDINLLSQAFFYLYTREGFSKLNEEDINVIFARGIENCLL